MPQPTSLISPEQLRKLQVLFSQYLRAHSLNFVGIDSRQARLAWGGKTAGACRSHIL